MKIHLVASWKREFTKRFAIITTSFCCDPSRDYQVVQTPRQRNAMEMPSVRIFERKNASSTRAPLEGSEFNDTPEGGFELLRQLHASVVSGAKDRGVV